MRKFVAVGLALTLVLTLAACSPATGEVKQSNPPVPSPGETQPALSSVVNYGISNAWDALMPYNSPSGSNYSRMIYDKIYDRLAYVSADGTLSPRAAKRWESADDGMSILFYLDERAAFHDGIPVTAHNWAKTLALMTDPNCPTLGGSSFNVLAGTTEDGILADGKTLGVEAVDDYTLKFTLKNPTTPENFLLDKNREYYVLPTHLMEGTDPADLMTMELWNAPVGSGPCEFVSEVAGSQLTLAANLNYQLGAPGFGQMVITVMDKSNLLTALIAGDLDYYAIGGNISVEDAEVAKNAGLSVQEGTIPTTFYELMLNSKTLPTPELRRAVEMALDKELLCQQNTAGLGKITDTSVLPGSPADPYGADTAAKPRDLEGAKALLATSGYDGRVFKLVCTANRSGLAALIQQNLEEAGIRTEIETVDSPAMFAGMADGTYDMGIASHTPTPLPLWFVETRFTENNNIFHVEDLSVYTVDMAAVKAETDPTAQKDMVRVLDEYLMEQRPFIPLWFARALHVESPTITGIDYASASSSNENVWQWSKP